MKLKFNCDKCGKLLGYYEGEGFIIEGAPDLRILCHNCYKVKEAKPR